MLDKMRLGVTIFVHQKWKYKWFWRSRTKKQNSSARRIKVPLNLYEKITTPCTDIYRRLSFATFGKYVYVLYNNWANKYTVWLNWLQFSDTKLCFPIVKCFLLEYYSFNKFKCVILFSHKKLSGNLFIISI